MRPRSAPGGKKLCAHGSNPSQNGLRQQLTVTPPFRRGLRHRYYSSAARTAGPSRRSRSTGSLAKTKRM